MGFPVTVESEDGLKKVEIVKKIDSNTLVDGDGIVYVRTNDALVFKPNGDQLSLFEIEEPGDELVLAGSEPQITPIEQFEILINESADRAKGAGDEEPSISAEDAEDIAAQIDAAEEGGEDAADESAPEAEETA